jgi:hypothetical protein
LISKVKINRNKIHNQYPPVCAKKIKFVSLTPWKKKKGKGKFGLTS